MDINTHARARALAKRGLMLRKYIFILVANSGKIPVRLYSEYTHYIKKKKNTKTVLYILYIIAGAKVMGERGQGQCSVWNQLWSHTNKIELNIYMNNIIYIYISKRSTLTRQKLNRNPFN